MYSSDFYVHKLFAASPSKREKLIIPAPPVQKQVMVCQEGDLVVKDLSRVADCQ